MFRLCRTAFTALVFSLSLAAIAANLPPTVSISSPASGLTFTAPASITLNATAADSDGTVANVKFYRGTTLLGTDTTAPYSYSWTNVAAGTYSITAKATDNLGLITTSSVVTVTVAANVVPTISITSPVTGATFTTPASITINANASDVNNGTVTKVDFYRGTTLLGTDTTSPYAFTWTNAAAGSYSITAKATDNSGAVTTSTAVAITVVAPNTPPTVSITSPAAGASFTAPAAITINATATDANGTVTKVDFYNGATLLGSDTTSPYSFAWANVAAGSYSITAKATDNAGAVTTSSAISLTVAAPNALPTVSISSPASGSIFTAPAAITINAIAADANGTVTKVDFYNGATLLGSDTTSPYSFAWTNVAIGNYSITAKATDNSGAVTTSSAVAVTVSAANTPPTVNITSPATGASFSAPAAITINATAADSNGTVSKVDFYNGTTLLGTSNTSPYSFAWTNVAAGSYSITAKATDNAGAVTTSSAIAVTVNAVNPGLTVNLTSPANGSIYAAPATVTFSAVANNLNGTLSKIQFFSGTSSLCLSDITSLATSAITATCTPSGLAVGTYNITAKVTDNLGAVATSGVTSITVQPAPPISLTSPNNGAIYTAPATITLNATTAYNNGTVTKVDFYNGVTLLGTSTTAPYAFAWVNVPVGSYSITAKATDNAGAVTTSSAISISVVAANPGLTVNLTSPANGSIYTAPATVTFSAAANNLNGKLSRIDFYSGTNALCLSDIASFATSAITATCTPSSFAIGTYEITVKVTDNLGAVTTTGVTTITVQTTNILPTVSITSPAANSNFNVFPASVNITATAADSDGSIAKVEFYQGTALLGTSTTAPYSYLWAFPPNGSYNLTAKATDNRGGATTSSGVNITVAAYNAAPTISLTSPVNGKRYVTTPANIPLTASAADSDGTIVKVEFYNGSTLIGMATTAPYNITWNGVGAGTYTITAKATDDKGTSTTTAGIIVKVGMLDTITYLHNDFAGSPLAATDAAGNIVWKENYRPFGDKVNNQAAAADNRQWFHGKAADADTGLQYFGARYYDPVLGRFMGVDPVGFQEDNIHSFNKYAYGNNNPYRYVDPDGRMPVLVYALYVASVRGSIWLAQRQAGAIIAAEIGAGVATGAVVPSVALEGVAAKAVGKIGGESSLAARGRDAHKNYENALGEGYVFNKALPSGKRPDAIDFENRIVRELKPENARAIKRGEKQVEGYKRELEGMTGEKWTSHVDTYNKSRTSND
jgi:RHS repeat-associated protein